MNIQGLGFGAQAMAGALDSQTIGAQVVTKTMDYMNQGSSGAGATYAPTDKQTFGGAVVSKTLEYMNQNQFRNGSSGSNADYDFQTSVLSAGYAPKGGVANVTV